MPETLPAYAPCAHCGAPVLLGQTRAGTPLWVDVHVPTYCVSWDKGAGVPWLDQSRAYPVHRCEAATSATASRKENLSHAALSCQSQTHGRTV
jgi:hypothetical protein